jgi:hypothetical protein
MKIEQQKKSCGLEGSVRLSLLGAFVVNAPDPALGEYIIKLLLPNTFSCHTVFRFTKHSQRQLVKWILARTSRSPAVDASAIALFLSSLGVIQAKHFKNRVYFDDA